MASHHFSRRSFVKASAAAAVAAVSFGHVASAQTLRKRPDWQRFRLTEHFASFVYAIGAMRDNPNPADRASWAYWADAHERFCPHGAPYFFAWHRGFLYYFEQQLQAVSGNPALQLPYWDYYRDPAIPAEFTDPSMFNPLHVERMTTDVRDALTLDPFGLPGFERGAPASFEASFEPRPHGEIHNLIGTIMAGMRSPLDPIFWLHHAQVDRLWHAWTIAGAGRHMPAPTDSYWDGMLTYHDDLAIERRAVLDPRTALAYTYEDETLPGTLPAQAAARPSLMRASLRGTRKPSMLRVAMDATQARPPAGGFAAAAPRQLSETRRSIGGAREVTLNDGPVTAAIAIDPTDAQALQAIAASVAPSAARTAELVLDDLRIASAGVTGGYLYRVYLNPPRDGPASLREQRRVGSFGPFEISGARHHGHSATLVFPLTQALATMTADELGEMAVSFVRVGGSAPPGGTVIVIGEVRIELASGAAK